MTETDTDTATFHMVQLALDPRRLVQLGKMLHLPLARTGTNYLVHCALGELFQDQAPKPFSVEAGTASANGRHVRVLGYAGVDRAALHELAKGFASPAVYEISDWDRAASKPMPGTFPEGMRLRFELRACPVVRKASAGEGRTSTGERRTWREGQELDAFLAHVWTLDDPAASVDRESVYRDWLARQLDLRGGAALETVGMDRFSIERMMRRTHAGGPAPYGRKARTVKRPDATLTGTLRVTDSGAFVDLLKSGIGRHKSFGFGMLKVRRA